MKTVSVKFTNYYRSYAYTTKLNLVAGKCYKITANNATYSTPVVVEGYIDHGPEGIVLKEITDAIEITEDDRD